jgi:hypothetical protein
MSGFPHRCQHLKVNGTQCESPALRRQRFCFFHKRFQDERIKLAGRSRSRAPVTFTIPVLEDANSIQVSLMQVMRLLVSQQMDHKTASLLLYALQTASTNLRRTHFEPYSKDVILDPRDAAGSALGEDLWSDHDFEQPQSRDLTAAQRERALAAREQACAEKEKEIERLLRAAQTASRMEEKGRLERAAARAARQAAQAPNQAPDLSTAAPKHSVIPNRAESPVEPALSGVEGNLLLPLASSSPANAPLPAKTTSPAAPPPKKPASSLNTERVRAELKEMIRKELPALTEVLAQSQRSGQGG